MAQPQADRVWVAMAETSAGALVERVAEAGAECMDGDLEGQDGLKGFSIAGIHLRGASAGVNFCYSIGYETGAIIRTRATDRVIEGRETWEAR